MNRERRTRLIRVLIGYVAVAAVLTGIGVRTDLVPFLPSHVYWGEPDAARQLRDTRALREVLPVLERLQVKQYVNRDWCRAVVSAKGTWVDPPDADCVDVFGRPTSRVPGAQADFPVLGRALDGSRVWVDGLSAEFDNGGTLTSVEFDLILAFPFAYNHYVYEPGYTLPEDMPGETKYTRIDSDWYYYWMDWM